LTLSRRFAGCFLDTAITGYTHVAGVEVVSGLADHAAGAAATTALPAGKIAVTVDLHVNFLAPAKGQTLHANARTLRVGGTICVVAVALETDPQESQAPCAVAHVTLRVVDMPPLK